MTQNDFSTVGFETRLDDEDYGLVIRFGSSENRNYEVGLDGNQVDAVIHEHPFSDDVVRENYDRPVRRDYITKILEELNFGVRFPENLGRRNNVLEVADNVNSNHSYFSAESGIREVEFEEVYSLLEMFGGNQRVETNDVEDPWEPDYNGETHFTVEPSVDQILEN